MPDRRKGAHPHNEVIELETQPNNPGTERVFPLQQRGSAKEASTSFKVITSIYRGDAGFLLWW